MVGKYPVITLCGSSMFEEQARKEQLRLTLEGNLVLGLTHQEYDWGHKLFRPGSAQMMDDMHLRKIDMSDAIYVINKVGYLENSTKAEIEYARKQGKEVQFYDENVYSPEDQYWGLGGNTGSLMDQVTPSEVRKLRDGEIFVFGSNAQGMHGAGAARVAVEKFGAKMGKGEGLQGSSYAIPTMEGLESLKGAVDRFTEYARGHRDLNFFVTAVGCGIAGYTPEEVAPFFYDAAQLSNVYLPVSFWKVIMKLSREPSVRLGE